MRSNRRRQAQRGFTLVELVIALALGVLLMSALTSVVYTSWRGAAIAADRLQASSQIRNFEYFAYDDFAQSAVSSLGDACTESSPCTTPIALASVTYTWDGSRFLDRSSNSTGAAIHVASDATAFSWFVDTNSTVVVSLTVTVSSYSESQTFRFYPRVSP